jgi:hypothetical protein
MVLRVCEYLADRSLWLDELTIARGIIDRSYLGLVKPLAGAQAAPVGWLWLERSAVELFGDSEWVLRLVPFILSLGSLLVFYFVVRRWLAGLSAVLACAMFALSPDLIRYAVEVKQYGSDVFFVLLVVMLTTRVYDQPSNRITIIWAGACVLAMWSSHAAVGAAGASTVALLVLELRSRRPLRPMLYASGLFGLSLIAEYLVTLRAISDNASLNAYWSVGLAPQHFGVGRTLSWLWGAQVHLATNPLQLAFASVGWILVMLGALLFVARRGWPALLVFSPVLATIIGGLLRVYPMRARLSLYLVPLLFIGLAALAETRVPLRRNPVAIAGAVLVVAIALPLGRGMTVIGSPIDVTDSRGPYAFVASGWRPGDALITGPFAEQSYQYYGPRYHLTRTATFAVGETRRPCSTTAEFASLRKYRRVWVALTHHGGSEPADRTELYFSQFAQLGPEEATFHGTGDAAAAVFDVQRTPVASPRMSKDVHKCLVLHS